MSATSARTLYRYIPVWERVEGRLSLYRVFEVIGRGFVVQSQDYFDARMVDDDRQLEQQFLQLLLDEAPESRMPPQPTIQEAIEDFDRAFLDEDRASGEPLP
jgi:hypothetical protein